MKKIGIITIESFNLGNRLQNYALQNILENMGYQVETIRRNKPVIGRDKIKRSTKILLQTIMQSKGAKFRLFDSKINKSKFYASANQAPIDLTNQYDYFVAGSDQIWNPYYDFVGSVDYLYFAKAEQKIAYAASFGVSEFPDEKKEELKEYLKDFKYISVREDAGAQIIKELTGRDVPVVLDPTLMLSVNAWRKMEHKPRNMPSGEYVLVYSVDKMSKEFVAEVEKEAVTNKIVNVREIQANGHEWAVGPAEFLYLVDHAKMIYTDSFHGLVFAILFHTKFKVFGRDGIQMSSRIDTLMEKTGLKTSDSFEQADQYVVALRRKSKQFLAEALGKE